MANSTKIASRLVAAAKGSRIIQGAEGWNNGWGSEEYRRSDDALIEAPEGAVSLTDKGVTALETAAETLLSDGSIRDRWHESDIWKKTASLVGFLATKPRERRPSLASENVPKLLSPEKVTVFQAVANGTWLREPMRIGDCFIGNYNEAFFELLESQLHLEAGWAEEAREAAARGAIAWPEGTVLFGGSTRFQGSKAVDWCDEQLTQLLSLALLVSADGAHLRVPGNPFEPGPRGIVLDRNAVDGHISLLGRSELGSRSESFSSFGRDSVIRWYGADVLDLSELLRGADNEGRLSTLAKKSGPVAARLLVAARWFWKAVWSENTDDAVLSYGVALDAVIGGKQALPGIQLRQRFGLLEADPAKREERESMHQDLYGPRSAVAHGSRASDSSTLSKQGGLPWMRREVHWAAHRLLSMEDAFGPIADDRALNGLWDDLRLGTRSWPA